MPADASLRGLARLHRRAEALKGSVALAPGRDGAGAHLTLRLPVAPGDPSVE